MVKAWREKVVIPTYGTGKPEKNPMFLEKRVYQGSSGVVYPYQVIESISDEKEDREYDAVWLENEYIKVMILPELGGRIQMAWDKIAKRHFIYYNHVIKPALVGLTGPWISGGIEFNWPQHHRPSTFMPVDSGIEENADGSVTVWVSERERMFHQKGMAGFTLRPGCAYLEIKGVLYNPTELPQTFLWWANPAVHVNDAYQSVFPPDVNAVFDHGKRAVSTFPIATGVYYKMDYSAGVDISNYRNIPVPTSYMIADSKYDFEGGWENDTRAGMLHVANHHVSPGKKQWTWGNGDFGRAWDRNLTDSDGPYIELMAGVYTENQPDFSWLMPYEEKSFTQYFFPYRELGIVKNASRDLVLNMLPEHGDRLRIMAFATSRQDCRISVRSRDGKELYSEELPLSPEIVYERVVSRHGCPFDQIVFSVNGLRCQTENDLSAPVPDPAEPAENQRTVTISPSKHIHPVQVIDPRQGIQTGNGGRFPLLPVHPPEINTALLLRMVEQLEVVFHIFRVGNVEGHAVHLLRIEPHCPRHRFELLFMSADAVRRREIERDFAAAPVKMGEKLIRIREVAAVPGVAGPPLQMPVHVDHHHVDRNSGPVEAVDQLFNFTIAVSPVAAVPVSEGKTGRNRLGTEHLRRIMQRIDIGVPVSEQIEILTLTRFARRHPLAIAVDPFDRDVPAVVDNAPAGARKKSLAELQLLTPLLRSIPVEDFLVAVATVQRPAGAEQVAVIGRIRSPDDLFPVEFKRDVQVCRGKSLPVRQQFDRQGIGGDNQLSVLPGSLEVDPPEVAVEHREGFPVFKFSVGAPFKPNHPAGQKRDTHIRSDHNIFRSGRCRPECGLFQHHGNKLL